MGFLGGGFFGSGASESTNTTNVTTLNQQLAGGDVTGVATGFQHSDNNVVTNTYIQTDQGAIKGATDIASGALALGATGIAGNVAIAGGGLQVADDALKVGEHVAKYGLDNAQLQLETSLGFNSNIVNSALGTVKDTNAAAFDYSNKAFTSALGFGTSALNNNTDLAKQFVDYTSRVVGTAISGNAQLASQVSQSSGQTVADSLTKIATIAAIALIGIYAFKSK